MQRKQNNLAVRALKVKFNENKNCFKINFEKRMREQVDKINENEETYIKTLVNQSQKSQKRIQACILADLTRQQQQFQDRMLKRIKSAGKL